jgi:peptidyl-dipeptidase Dcp
MTSSKTDPGLKAQSSDSILLDPWPGPFGGLPPFDQVCVDEFLDAFDQAIGQADREVEAIAENPSAPTFENTLVAMENAGRTLKRVGVVFYVHASNLNLGPIPEIERQVSPKVAAHKDRIFQNASLFARIDALHAQLQGGELQLADDAKRLLENTHREFVRHGARLSADDKTQLTKINSRLARLFTDFSQNVLADEKALVVWIEDQADLAGLSQSTIDAMAASAQDHGRPGMYAVTNTRSSIDPFLTDAENREIREQVWRMFYNRCDNGGPNDNADVIREILDLRIERADLLGYPTHAHWRLEGSMAATPERSLELMMRVWKPAVARVAEEVAAMQEIADKEQAAAGQPNITIEPWDYRFYGEKVRKAKYDLDMAAVRPYLQLNKLIDAMFTCADQLFGLQFSLLQDVPIFHPDVTVYEVQKDGEHVGVFYLDPFAREGKRSGAWMMGYRAQSGWGLPSTTSDVPVASPIVSNTCNFVPPAPGQPALISWDDATTLFHEFGHGLHGLCSQVHYPSQAGTAVPRDFVEFPSQIMEHWLSTPEVLKQFAVHVETGEPMPQSLIEKIERSNTFNSGFETTEYLACAILDMKLHTMTEGGIDIAAFEEQALAEIAMPKELPMRHRMPHFSHLFISDGYSAGYYSYLWSDALTADAAELFEQSSGGYFDQDIADKLFDHILSVGDTIDPAETYRKFLGRDLDPDALLRKRGFKR